MVTLVKQNLKKNKEIYNDVVKKMRELISTDVPITHVGSTVIPNMYGKNIVDILIGAKDLVELEELSTRVCMLGFYGSKKNKKGDIYKFFASSEEETKSGDVHIHLALMDTDRYKDFIIIKDYLLNNKEEAKQYSNFKRNLLANGHDVRSDYKKLKSDYVSALILRAKDNRNSND